MRKLTTLGIVLSTALMGCLKNPELTVQAPKDPTVPQFEKVEQKPLPPAPKKHQTYVQGITRPIQYEPKADIVFVVDTSDSMRCDQDKLKRNLRNFTQAFTSNQGKFLDYHMGVVSVWDSKLFETPIGGRTPKRKCLNGQLRPVGGGECNSAGLGKENFVTKKTPNLEETLSRTLTLGIEDFISNSSLGANPSDEKKLFQAENSGPQDEELFSPVLALLSVEGSKMNPNFRRKDVPLSIIFITDTEDATPGLSPETFVENLKMEAGESTVSTYAVLARYDDLLAFEKDPSRNPLVPYEVGSMNSCSGKNGKVDPFISGAGQAPFRIHDVLSSTTNGVNIATGFDIDDDNYGKKLAAIAANIAKQSAKMVIPLDHPRNVLEPMVVRFGTQVIPQDDEKGWSYSVDDHGVHVVTLNEGVELKDSADAKITIEYTPAN